MSTVARPGPGPASTSGSRPVPTPGRPGRTRRRFTLLVGVSLTILIAASIAGLAIGSSAIPLQDVVDALTDYDPTNTNHVIVMASPQGRQELEGALLPD